MDRNHSNRRKRNYIDNTSSNRAPNQSNRRDETENKRRNRNQNDSIDNNNNTQKSFADKNQNQYIIGDRELKQLIDNHGNNPNVLLLELKREKSFLKLITDENRLKGRFDDYGVMCRVIHILDIICDSEPDILLPFIARICDSDLNQQIQNYLLRFPNLVNPLNSNQQNKHIASFNSLVKFVRQMQIRIPQSSRDKIKLIQLSLNDALEICNKKGDVIKQSTFELLKLIKTENEKALNNISLADEKAAKAEKMHAILQPPNSFREISICPTYDDIHVTDTPFLRSNLIKGKYFDVDHYLDVQFRLLREDYVRPLREGIALYLNAIKENKKFPKLKDIRVYSNVKIIGSQLKDGIIYDIQFDVSHLRNIRWQISDRLMYGSLLCLSSDHFQTFCFASVCGERIEEKLKKGIVSIKFETQTMNEELNEINQLLSLTMIESQAYFESYRHNLQALQTFNSENFPLQDYIINVLNNIENLPYINPNIDYDLTDLAHPLFKISSDDNNLGNIMLKIKTFKQNCKINSSKEKHLKCVRVLDSTSWPHINILGFDESQYDAFKAALTQQMVIIQGPPGTGKTYIGLRIVQTLLRNSKHWNGERNVIRSKRDKLIDTNLFEQSIHKPILIVCYTNHALDQFLEGMIPFCNENRGIVRIGGRSKSEILKSYTLLELKRKAKDMRIIPLTLHSSLMSSRREIKQIQEKISQLQRNIVKHNKQLLNASELSALSFKYVWIVALMNYLRQYANDVNLAIVIWLTEKSDWVIVDEGFEKNVNLVQEDDEFKDEEELRAILDARIIDIEEYDNDYSNDVRNNEREKSYGDKDKDVITKNMSKDEAEIFKRFVKQELKTDGMEDEDIYHILYSIRDISHLSHKERWSLYRRCVDICCKDIQTEINNLHEKYINEYRNNKRLKLEEDLCVIRGCDVIGMTTTGAAKYRSIIEQIDPSVVVIEEAAEVLESHVITSLTKSTNHLILIGDHMQLKPKPNVYELIKKYNLDVSLFERMINNDMPYYPLKLQHRMRPNISSLLVPHFYKELRDHQSVNAYEDIKGMANNMYFLNHNEMESYYNESQSKFNEFEANFVVYLCKYLIQQQYKPSQITIIVMYSAQLFRVKNIMKEHQSFLEGVRVTVIDNYQGEENDIIILSFVRSNIEGTIGFLKISNRINVALSRARMGLYGIGNFDCLADKSDLWKSIMKDLMEQKAIGEHLEIYCQNHPTFKTLISKASDFIKVPEGGCTKLCEYRLDCGHVCPQVCHVYDHELVNCHKICNKKYEECEHICVDICHYPDSCKPCKVRVMKTIATCGHQTRMYCSTDPLKFKCFDKCERMLSCGHKCTDICGVECNPLTCKENVKVLSQCGHEVDIRCSLKNNREKLLSICTEDCNTVLKCGHICSGSCGKCQQNRLHVKCQMKCSRVLVCGHVCKAVCGDNCPPCRELCRNRCFHSECKRKCGEPCDPCLKPCKWKCIRKKCTRKCSEKCDRELYVKPCNKKLKCGHSCIGICGEQCPQMCRICNKQEFEQLFLGKELEPNARFIQLEDCRHIIELKSIIESNESKNNSAINMIRCPRCETIIRNSKLFNTSIQKALSDIELVKLKLNGNFNEIETIRNLILKDMEKYFTLDLNVCFFENKWLLKNKMRNLFDVTKSKQRKSQLELYIIKAKFDVIKQLTAISAQLSKYKSQQNLNNDVVNINSQIDNTYRRIDKLLKYIDSLLNNEQQTNDLQNEMKFIQFSTEIIKFLSNKVFENEDEKSNFVEAFNLLSCLGPLSEEKMFEIKALVENSNKIQRGFNVRFEEKQMIVKAINFSDGHWFKCPNGHPYCIEEFGVAMQQIKVEPCSYKCERVLSCGHKCPRICGIACEPLSCIEKVRLLADCGHEVYIGCLQRNNSQSVSSLCDKKCGTVLKCGHKCGGSCVECQQNRLHVKCEMRCERVLVCGHICKAVCGDNCPPCREKCQNQCYHSKCKRFCGEPCAPCLEPCIWICEHKKCTRKCSEKCDRELCVEPCAKKLKCGHSCIGICGERCPQKCRVCNKLQVGKIVFGYEKEPKAKFIQLDDCGHIFESKCLIEWLSKNKPNHSNDRNNLLIQMKSCPRCKTIIRKTKLFNTPIQQSLRDIELVKIKLFGKVDESKKIRNFIITKMEQFFVLINSNENKKLLINKLENLIDVTKYKQRISQIELNLIKTKFDIIKHLSVISDKLSIYKFQRKYNKDFADINNLIDIMCRRIEIFTKYIDTLVNNEQQINDLQNEMKFIQFSRKIIKVSCDREFDNEEAKSNLIEAFKLLSCLRPLSEEKKNEIKDLINKANKLQCGLDISFEEKQMIVKAMNFSGGNWYKCLNGHVYSIGECDTFQVNKCPQCNRIDDSSHGLLSDNAVVNDIEITTQSSHESELEIDFDIEFEKDWLQWLNEHQ